MERHTLALAEAQAQIAAICPSDYYQRRYRAMEADYLPVLCELLSDFKSGRALDIGPGWGTMAAWLACRGWEVTLADLVPLGHYITDETLSAIERLTGHRPVYVRYDVCDAPLPGEPFELVLMSQVLPHLKWRPDRAVRNCAAMTAPNGKGLFLATVLDREAYPKLKPPYKHWREVPEKGHGQPSPETVVVMYDRAEFRELLYEGFSVVSVQDRRATSSTCLFAAATRGNKTP